MCRCLRCSKGVAYLVRIDTNSRRDMEGSRNQFSSSVQGNAAGHSAARYVQRESAAIGAFSHTPYPHHPTPTPPPGCLGAGCHLGGRKVLREMRSLMDLPGVQTVSFPQGEEAVLRHEARRSWGAGKETGSDSYSYSAPLVH